MSDVKYLIFDIETVGDGDLIQKVRFPDEDSLSEYTTDSQGRPVMIVDVPPSARRADLN